MLLHHIKTTLRSIRNNKGYALVNIFGLTLGMTAWVMLMMWVNHEMTYDDFHKNADHIYRPVAVWNETKGEPWFVKSTPAPLPGMLKEQMPEVEHVVRVYKGRDKIFQNGSQIFSESKVAYTDPSLFDIFNFSLKEGDVKTALSNPNNLVITQGMAKKYFGDQPAIGQSLIFQDSIPVTVTGILDDIPSNSVFDYEGLFPLQLYKQTNLTFEENWNNFNYTTFVKLSSNQNIEKIEDALTKIYREARYPDGSDHYFFLQPLKDVHLYSNFKNKAKNPQVAMLVNLGIIAFLILLIACINYANLATAQASGKAKEVSVRKIIGASGKWLFGRFIIESIVITGISIIFAIILLELCSPVFNQFVEKTIHLDIWSGSSMVILLLAMIITIILSGIYPAIIAASFSPIRYLKGQSVRGKTNEKFRKGLVIFQFMITIFLIIATIIIHTQLDFMNNQDLGFDKENIFYFYGSKTIRNNKLAIKDELKNAPGIDNVTLSDQIIHSAGSWTDAFEWPGHIKEGDVKINQISVDVDFFDMFNLEMIAGQPFTQNTPEHGGTYIINETAAKQLGMQEPLGVTVSFQENPGVITGVVKDFHFKSLHHQIDPLIMLNGSDWLGTFSIKTSQEGMAQALTSAEKIWKKYSPTQPFEYHFIDQQYQDYYKTEQRSGMLLTGSALLCIIISCLGLFALMTFIVARRMKEISIRKVLGATMTNIVTMLSKDFIQLVIVAMVLASPIAWYVMNNWLRNFAYAIDFKWWIFPLATLIIIVISMLTISINAIKAALVNPAELIKNE